MINKYQHQLAIKIILERYHEDNSRFVREVLFNQLVHQIGLVNSGSLQLVELGYGVFFTNAPGDKKCQEFNEQINLALGLISDNVDELPEEKLKNAIHTRVNQIVQKKQYKAEQCNHMISIVELILREIGVTGNIVFLKVLNGVMKITFIIEGVTLEIQAQAKLPINGRDSITFDGFKNSDELFNWIVERVSMELTNIDE